jgi:hypothetical protein
MATACFNPTVRLGVTGLAPARPCSSPTLIGLTQNVSGIRGRTAGRIAGHLSQADGRAALIENHKTLSQGAVMTTDISELRLVSLSATVKRRMQTTPISSTIGQVAARPAQLEKFWAMVGGSHASRKRLRKLSDPGADIHGDASEGRDEQAALRPAGCSGYCVPARQALP